MGRLLMESQMSNKIDNIFKIAYEGDEKLK
jgi:hypothetical protein